MKHDGSVIFSIFRISVLDFCFHCHYGKIIAKMSSWCCFTPMNTLPVFSVENNDLYSGKVPAPSSGAFDWPTLIEITTTHGLMLIVRYNNRRWGWFENLSQVFLFAEELLKIKEVCLLAISSFRRFWKHHRSSNTLPSHDCWDHQLGLLRFNGGCFLLCDQDLHHSKKHPTPTEWKSTCGVRQR